ncbi:MAG TPA: hypothetical protein VFG49_03400, partial [Dyella sp.]|uniref:hypothetical protein n=1 Tax=Dyella sp. TaxID=1869338 RepID=UPI002D79CF0A
HVKSWATILEDAFGNALGNAVIAGINAYQANQLPPIPVDASTTQMSISAPGVVVQNIPQTIAPVALVTPVDAQALLSPSDGLANAGTPTVAGQGATQWPSAADVPLISGVTIKPNGVYYEGLHRRAR